MGFLATIVSASPLAESCSCRSTTNSAVGWHSSELTEINWESSCRRRPRRSTAALRFCCNASRVVATVTKGLPSRSPPIHDENLSGGLKLRETSGKCRPSAKRKLSQMAGVRSNKASRKKCRPHATSLSTVGFSMRISPVSQRRSISFLRAASNASRSRGVQRGLSSSYSFR